MTKKDIDELSYKIIGCAIEVHSALGPGLLESVYHKCMVKEFRERGISFNSQLSVPIDYKGLMLDADLRCDLLVENSIAVELKAIEAMAPIHEAQVLTYMKLLGVPKGILINFTCVNIFKEGQRTFVNELYRQLPDE